MDTVTLTVKVPKALHRQFKTLCAATDKTMTEAVLAHMQYAVESADDEHQQIAAAFSKGLRKVSKK